jgi:hypothetical protein
VRALVGKVIGGMLAACLVAACGPPPPPDVNDVAGQDALHAWMRKGVTREYVRSLYAKRPQFSTLKVEEVGTIFFDPDGRLTFAFDRKSNKIELPINGRIEKGMPIQEVQRLLGRAALLCDNYQTNWRNDYYCFSDGKLVTKEVSHGPVT